MTAGRTVHSGAHHWGTPEWFVDAVRSALEVDQIALDPCGGPESVVGALVAYKPPQNGLVESWDYPTIYVNPPYGRDYIRGTTIKDWLQRCASAHVAYRSEIIALIPVAPNTRHWKDYIFNKAAVICFLGATRFRFRIDGNEVNKGCPMAVSAVYWGYNAARFTSVFMSYGALVRSVEQ